MADKTIYQAANGNTEVKVRKGYGYSGAFYIAEISIRGKIVKHDLSYVDAIAIAKADKWLREAGSQLDTE